MLCQEPPYLRQFQWPDLAALDRGKINHAAQFGRWACQSPIPNGTIFGAKTPCPTPPVWPPCPSIENNVNSHKLFFKWIKQHLRIKHFYGNSDNAVKTQIWIAVCVYVLLAILKKQLKSDLSLNTILQILSVNAFEKEPLHQLLTAIPSQLSEGNIWNQLIFNY